MNKKIICLSIIGTLLIMVISTSVSYAVWISNSTQEDENIAESGCFNVNLTSNTSALSVVNDFPKTDEDGMKRDPYSFSIENTCATDAAYKIKIELQSTNTLPSNLTKVSLNNKISLLSDLDNENDNYFVIESDYLEAGETKNYEFRQWFDISGTLDDSQNKTISTKIVLESTAAVILPKGTEVLANLLDDEDTSLVNDDPDQNIRYIGSNPNNYVSFNGEKWRIIGAFNNIKTTEDGTGETRLKIIGPKYSDGIPWNNSGIMDWSVSTLQSELNGIYYESLSNEAKSLIDETVWNIGGIDFNDYENDGTTSLFYVNERGTTVFEERPATWIGKIALMYVSDYGYATSGGGTKNREACLANELSNWNEDDYSDCKSNNYLFNSTNGSWSLNSCSDMMYRGFKITESGNLFDFDGYSGVAASASPVLNLKSGIRILSGSGTNDDPYIIGL